MRKFMTMAAAAAAFIAGPAMAQTTEITVQYAIPDIFKEVQEEIAKQFMAANPNIKVRFTQPTKEYEDATQQVLRNAVTGQLPDVTFQGLNRQRILADRNIAQPLDAFIAAEKDWAKAGYDGALLTLGQVKGKQYGMGFSLSTPIIYFNADLVKKAGGDPDNFPLDLGRHLRARQEDRRSGEQGLGLPLRLGHHRQLDVAGAGLLQRRHDALGRREEGRVRQRGRPEGDRHARRHAPRRRHARREPGDGAAGLRAGRLGIWAHSTSRLGGVTKQAQGVFTLRTARFPLGGGEASRLPAGGNVAMMLAKDPAKQKAAWEYIKFATGPVGATIMVKGTGYFPANALPAKDAKMLGDFYAQNPNHRVAIGQLPAMTAWYAFPGENGLKITDVIKDHLQSVVNQSTKPEDALKKMTSDTQALLPK